MPIKFLILRGGQGGGGWIFLGGGARPGGGGSANFIFMGAGIFLNLVLKLVLKIGGGGPRLNFFGKGGLLSYIFQRQTTKRAKLVIFQGWGWGSGTGGGFMLSRNSFF